MAKAIWKGQIIAESDDTVIVEGNHYFPPESLRKEFLVESDHTSRCHWKGTASYFHVVVDGESNPNAAWTYPETSKRAEVVKGRVAFWRGVTVER